MEINKIHFKSIVQKGKLGSRKKGISYRTHSRRGKVWLTIFSNIMEQLGWKEGETFIDAGLVNGKAAVRKVPENDGYKLIPQKNNGTKTCTVCFPFNEDLPKTSGDRVSQQFPEVLGKLDIIILNIEEKL